MICKLRTVVGVVRRRLYRVAFTSHTGIIHHYDTTRLSYHDGHTLVDSCARLARRRKFSRWHSKIAAPPFPEGSFRALSCSFIINNVILSCIPPLPPFVYTRPARCSACGLSSRRIVVLWCARRSHVVAPRVYESPPPRATPRIDLTARV